tara:strand:+ start:41 stop:913 length:873 start_codon:yes stop_codon:yes gene_type:complete
MEPTTALAISAGLNFVGGIFGRRSASKARKREEAFLLKKYLEYDLPGWEFGKERLIANRDEQIRQIQLAAHNELKLAKFKDKNNLRNYQQRLKIANFEHQAKLGQFHRSESLYHRAVGEARDQKRIRDEETRANFAYQNEDRILESIRLKSEMMAKGQSGQSAIENFQSQIAETGSELAILTRNIVSADRESRMQLRTFMTQADAQRMLRPTKAPDPLKPLKTPISDRLLPRELEDFDFGPKPIKGVATTPVPSMASVFASAAGAGFSAYTTATYGGTSTSNRDAGPGNY